MLQVSLKGELVDILKLLFPSSFIWTSKKEWYLLSRDERASRHCILWRRRACPRSPLLTRGFTNSVPSRLACDESQVMSLLDPDMLWQRSDRHESYHLPWQGSDTHGTALSAVIDPLPLISFPFLHSSTLTFYLRIGSFCEPAILVTRTSDTGLIRSP